MAGNFIPLNDAEKKLLSDRYLDLQFEKDIDDFVCVRCDRLAIVHFFTNCGHLLCLNCKRIIDNGGLTCPQCNTLITNASEHRDDFERRLLALRTKCPNNKYGCQFTTNLAQIPEHVGMCKFTREQALPALSTESNTMFSVLNKMNDLNGQIVELKLGFTKLNEYNVASEKYKEDLKIELRGLRSDINIEIRKRQEDSNQLKKDIAGEIQLSIETNLKKLIEDEFKKINLEISAIKKEITTINDKIKDKEQQEVQLEDKQLSISQLPNTKDHIEEILRHKSSICKLLDSFLFGSAEEQMAFESLCLKWTVNGKDMQKPAEEWHELLSNIFPVYGSELKAQLKLTIDLFGSMSLQLCFKDKDKEGQEVDIKPLPMVTFILKDLSGHNKHRIRYQYYRFNEPLQYNQFGYVIVLIKPHWNSLISPGDASLEVLVLVEPHNIIHKPLSVDGIITDTIEHYSRKLEMVEEGLIDGYWSPAFLTHAGGRRVAVWLGLSGSIGETRRGLAARISFMSGEFDSQLEWEFKHETCVTLINQWDAEENIIFKKQEKEVYYYDMTIASRNKIGSGGFLVNDSLTYHVTIKPIK